MIGKRVLLFLFTKEMTNQKRHRTAIVLLVYCLVKPSSDSYRPISLLPCFLKVFENVLKSRLNLILHETVFPNRQQQGFQKYLGCLTASFNLHKAVFHNLELCSKVCVAFLDSRNAFDTVWRIGWMYKLHKLGEEGRMWNIINDCHVNTQSAVVVNQWQSNIIYCLGGCSTKRCTIRPIILNLY